MSVATPADLFAFLEGLGIDDDLVAFLRATGHEPRILRLPEPPAETSQNASAAPS